MFRVQRQSHLNLFLTAGSIPEIMEHFEKGTGTFSIKIEAKVDDASLILSFLEAEHNKVAASAEAHISEEKKRDWGT